MLIKFAGTCDFCGQYTKAGEGDFQSIGSLSKKEKDLFVGVHYKGKWLIRCFMCKGVKHTKRYSEFLHRNQSQP